MKNEGKYPVISIYVHWCVYQHWSAILINNEEHRQDLVSEIDEDDMDDIILNAGGVLYYISRWLMNQLTKVKQKEKKNTISEFLSLNRVNQSDSQDNVTANLPTDVLHKWEVKGGKLIKTLLNFFCVINAIFATNISDFDKIWSIKGQIFKAIQETLIHFKQVGDVLLNCVSLSMIAGELKRSSTVFDPAVGW